MRIYVVTPQPAGSPAQVEPCTEDEVLFCPSGSGYLTIGGREMPLRAGDIVAVPAGTPCARLEQPGAAVAFQSAEAPLARIGVYRDDGQFETLYHLAVAAISRGGEFWRVYGYGLGNMMLRLLACLDSSAAAEAPLMVRQLHDRIHAGSADPSFDLAAEIEKTGYCAGYVRQLFRRTYGAPPRAYLSNLRVGYAKMLLRASRQSVSIKEVAQRSGFRDPYYFSRVFRQIEGVSPSEYVDRLEGPEG